MAPLHLCWPSANISLKSCAALSSLAASFRPVTAPTTPHTRPTQLRHRLRTNTCFSKSPCI